jgi:hypothetical protein
VLFATGLVSLVRERGGSASLGGPLLRKPYRPGELRRAVTALLDGSADPLAPPQIG